MSVGSRAQDDRRRRRLAVAGDGASDGGDGEAGALAVLRERSIDLPSASPWLPRATWKRFLIGGMFWLTLVAVAVLLIRPFPPHPQLAPAVDHLVGGEQPVLGVYADIVLWTLAASLATLVGWFRSHSQLDFHGRYRLWTWAAVVFAAWGFCGGTGIHTAVGAVAGPQLRWPIWRAETMVWLVPAMAAGLSVWWVIGRDLQRSRLNCELVRFAVITLLLTGVGRLYQPDFAHVLWWQGALLAGQYFGMGLLITGLWLHAGYVAYVCADPPEPAPPVDWRGRLTTVLSFVLGWLWPFGRWNAKAGAKKAAAEAEAPKRRRKSSKPKRRTRAKPKVESEECEESEEESSEEDESTEEESAADEDEWTEEDVEEAPAPAKPGTAVVTARQQSYSQVKPPSSSAPTKPAPPPAPSWSGEDSEEDSDSEDSGQYRVDGAHGGDPFKGLSKRQRRELKKQMRDQQRQQRR